MMRFRLPVILIVCTVLLTGCAMPGQGDDDDESLADGPLTLVQIERDVAGSPLGLVHLRLDPAKDGDNHLTIWLTDLMGATTSAPVAATATSLTDGTTRDDIALAERDGSLGADVDLAPEGWWQFDVTVEREAGATTTPFYALLPDPNIHGTDAAPTPDESAEARAVFDRAMSSMEAAPHLRWVESINTGNDTMVAIDFTQIAATASSPQAVEQHMRYSATFAERADGNPRPPQLDSYHAITIGDEGWILTADGTAATAPPTKYAPIAEWGNIYTAAERIAPGPVVDIDGEPMQVISFYSPEYNGQSQAWFVWWIEADTGRVYRIGMLARAHYMVWDYTDFDAPVTIDRPGVQDASPEASPVGG